MLITSQRWGCRFSSDQYRIDDSLPFIANILLSQAFMMIGLVIVLIYTQVHFWSLPKISFSVRWQDWLSQKEESRRKQKAFEKHVKCCVYNLSFKKKNMGSKKIDIGKSLKKISAWWTCLNLYGAVDHCGDDATNWLLLLDITGSTSTWNNVNLSLANVTKLM